MGFWKETLTTEVIVDNRSYIFDGVGGMGDQLEQTIIKELELKKYPFKVKIETVKSGSYGAESKEQCVTVELGSAHRAIISNTTVGSYLYVSIYNMVRVINSQNQIDKANTTTDIFETQRIQSAYAAVVATSESAFAKLELKQVNSGYRPLVSDAKNES